MNTLFTRRQSLNLALSLALGALALGSAGVEAQQRPEVAKYTRGFSGPQGLRVYITRIGPPAKNEALVGFAGVDNKWDGKVFLMSLSVSGNNREQYTIKLNGTPYTALTLEGDNGQAFLPDWPAAQKISYSADVSRQLTPDNLLNEYLKQR